MSHPRMEPSTYRALDPAFTQAVGEGQFSRYRGFTVPGRADAVSSTIFQDISQVAGVTILQNPGGIQLEVSSSDANDAAAGTGIQTVLLDYLDSAGMELSETITLNGLTPVLTVSTDIDKVQWMHSVTVGSTGAAVGTVGLESVGGATQYECITPLGNQSLTAQYHVPTGFTAYITGWDASAIAKVIDFRLNATVTRETRLLVPGVFLFHDAVILNNAASNYNPFIIPMCCPAGSTIKISGMSNGAGGDAGCSFDLMIVENLD